jgi:hypothetical protein
MFGIEHRQGYSTVERADVDTSDLDAAIAMAQRRAKWLRADNIRVSHLTGKVVGVFPVRRDFEFQRH